METVICNLCHHHETSLIYQVQDWLLNKPENISSFVRCQNCGLVYQNPRPTVEEIGQFYPPNYEIFNVDKVKQNSSRILQHIMQYGINKRCRVVNREKKGGMLLDVGCATGIFLETMRETQRWQVKGVELSKNASQIAREKNLDVITGTLEQANFSDGQFDVVTLWDVLEHLHDPAGSLNEIHRILKPNGIIVLRVPNKDSIDSQMFGPYWAGYDSPRHLYVFNQQTLTKLLEISGFSLKRTSCEIGNYPAFVLSLCFWMLGHGMKSERRERITHFLNSPFARGISAPIFFLVGFFKKGSSLIVTANRC